MVKEKDELTAKEFVLKKYPDAHLIRLGKIAFRVQVLDKCSHCEGTILKILGEGFSEDWAWHNASTFIQYAKSEKRKKK